MKVIGGSFGARGTAWLSRDKRLVVEGAIRKVYASHDITQLQARLDKERKFGFFGFLIGLIVVAVVAVALVGVVGPLVALLVFLVGLLIAVFGSFYTDKNDAVDLVFSDGESVTLHCTPRSMKKLVAFRSAQE